MAPESITQPYFFQLSSDSWSVAAIGFEMFAKGKPLCTENKEEECFRIVNSENYIANRLKMIPNYIAAILNPMLAKNCSQRPILEEFFPTHVIWEKHGLSYDSLYEGWLEFLCF